MPTPMRPRRRPSARRLPRVRTGLEVLARARPRWQRGRGVGLLLHPASVTPSFVSARDVIRDLCGKGLRALFGPQHGFAGEKQDNMIESAHAVDPDLDIPIYSLYSETRSPTRAMLDGIDLLLVDLQDVGTRVYTFEWTTALALEACASTGRRLVVLDRPNPLGGATVEGNLIRPGYTSFVGLSPVPMRHALTLGEFAALMNRRLAARAEQGPGRPGPRGDGIGVCCPGLCELSVVPMEGWRRPMLFPDTGLPWVLPSPNVPSFETALVYPGQVLLEGTNLSEGRGTTRPFEIFGAPYLDPRRVRKRFESRRLPGVALREHCFEPTFNKWAGRLCRGFQIQITDAAAFRPYATTLALLQDIIAVHRDRFEWREPPYEYVTDRLPIDVLSGDPEVRDALESGGDLRALERSWRKEIAGFERESAAVRLYR
ncbi:MAG: exo-beta-N-acetylmuramidase NamZ domain-containing protein [Acidobacteriota bacterium]